MNQVDPPEAGGSHAGRYRPSTIILVASIGNNGRSPKRRILTLPLNGTFSTDRPVTPGLGRVPVPLPPYDGVVPAQLNLNLSIRSISQDAYSEVRQIRKRQSPAPHQQLLYPTNLLHREYDPAPFTSWLPREIFASSLSHQPALSTTADLEAMGLASYRHPDISMDIFRQHCVKDGSDHIF